MLKTIVAVVVVLIVAVVLFMGYMGLLVTPKVFEQITGPYTYAYEEFIGDYKKTGPAFERVNKALIDQNITSPEGIGVYFDDPAKVPSDKLRSYCGAIINESDAVKLTTNENLKIGKIEEQKSVIVELPIKNSLSYMLGPIKAYPALGKYISQKGYKVKISFELYDMQGKKIRYVMQCE